MLLRNLFTLSTLASASFAYQPKDKNDAGRLAASLVRITNAIGNITTVFIPFTGDVLQGADILQNYTDFIAVLDAEKEYIAGIRDPGPMEVVRMLPTVTPMLGKVRALIDMVISKKPEFAINDLTPAVITTVGQAKISTTAIIDTVRTIVPPKAYRVMDHVVDQVIEEISRLEKAFGGEGSTSEDAAHSHGHSDSGMGMPMGADMNMSPAKPAEAATPAEAAKPAEVAQVAQVAQVEVPTMKKVGGCIRHQGRSVNSVESADSAECFFLDN